MPESVEITVYGTAAPAGSKTGFYRGGRVIITDASRRSRPWKALVSDAAIEAMQGRDLLDEALEVTICFYMLRPRAHFGKKGVRASAPLVPVVRPDLLKLARGVEDALSGLVYRDDSQIVDEYLHKRYGDPARCEITVRSARLPAELSAGD